MKWAYLPIMFALSFLYTKLSFTDFMPKNETKPTGSRELRRAPASITPAEKIKPFRQRVAPEEFYRNLSHDSLNVFLPVSSFSGTIVSDVHVDNFGFVIDDSKHVNYGIIDFRETSRGKYFHDVLSHLVSAKALDKRTTWMDYFEAYKTGLKGYAHSNSFYVDKGISDAISDSEHKMEENITHEFPLMFTGLKKQYVHLNAIEKSLVEVELKRVFPKIQIFEILTKKSEEKEYQILARTRAMDKVQWLVLKESGNTDHDDFFGSNITLSRRMDKIKEDIYGKKLNDSLFIMKIDNIYFTAFYNERFSSRLNLDDVPFDDYHDIVLDQANALGQIHARSLGEQTDDYIKAWARIPAATVDEKTIELKYKFKDLNE